MQKESKDKHFIKKPVYEGGMKAMRLFIAQQMRYPKAALEQKIEGTVYIKYSINYQGKVVNTKVISSLGHGCDEEAIRLVKLLTFKVAKIRKGKILYHKSIQIHFKLPVKKEQDNSTVQLTYHYVEKPNPKHKSKGINYTIKW